MERQQKAEILETQVVEQYAKTFVARADCYPKQLATGKYVRVDRPLTLQHVYDHLYGLANMTLGAYALDRNSLARWVCFDADDDEQFMNLSQSVPKLAELGQTAYLEWSRRGGHLWLFFSPISGYEARRFAKQLASEIGIQEKKLELYPKQDYLDKNGYGSLVRLPLGVHRKTGQRYYFIHPDGTPLAPTIRDQVRLLSNPVPVAPDFIASLLSRAPQWEQVAPTPAFTRVEPRSDLPLSEAIKGSVSVSEFVSRYVSLNSKGIGLCPFHDDREYSFSVNDEDNYWHCFAGCGGGSVIDFWMKWRERHGEDGAFTATLLQLRDMLLSPAPHKKHQRR